MRGGIRFIRSNDFSRPKPNDGNTPNTWQVIRRADAGLLIEEGRWIGRYPEIDLT